MQNALVRTRPVHSFVRAAVRPTAAHTRGVVGALNAEWARLAGPDSAPLVQRWARSSPAFRGLGDLRAVVSAVRGDDGDEVLRALLRLARQGDQLAARAALQAMLGAAVRLARRTLPHADGDLEEALARAVAALWQVVRDYPVDRRACRAADGVSLDVLGVLTGTGRGPDLLPGGELPSEVPEAAEPAQGGMRDEFWCATGVSRPGACGDEQVILLLAWAVRERVISAQDARLLLRLHSPADPEAAVSCRDVAEELGIGHAAVRQRASRATRRVAAAVRVAALGSPAATADRAA